MIKLNEFEQAEKRLSGVVHKIDLISSKTFSDITGASVYLKCENGQKTGSFKVRGAYNKIMKLSETTSLKHVVASSAGNHAQGVAFSATNIGIKSTIVMPRSAAIAKVAATEGYGATVVLSGHIYDDAYKKAIEICEEENAVFIHPFDDTDVIAGQGTIGLEILKDLPNVDIVVVPAGGGGLISGVATCIKQINPRVKIIGVQAEGASAIYDAFHGIETDPNKSVHTIADGIAVKTPGTLTLELIKENVDDMVTVSDAEIAETILLLLERCKQVVEPAGATSLAAVLNNKIDITDKKVACVLSGGNIDVSFIHRIVEKGLVSRGRHIKFKTILTDAPGALEKFANIMNSLNANITMFQHDRLQADLAMDEAIIHVVCEVGGFAHGKLVVSTLEDHGYTILMENNT